jgi:hypothetical protein
VTVNLPAQWYPPFIEAGGTLDFYYQVTNNLTAANCGTAGKPSCDPISRETDTTFTGFSTALGFRTDVFGPFVSGTVAPVTGDRNAGVGNAIGFSFSPPDSAKIQPGQTTFILAISTDATNFTTGQASLIDGGVTSVASFQPTSQVPEPASFLLIGGGLVALIGVRRFLV